MVKTVVVISIGHQGATVNYTKLKFVYFLPRNTAKTAVRGQKKATKSTEKDAFSSDCCTVGTKSLVRSVPLMELPPLSPGIQARVMEEVEVVETVSRG